MSESQDRISKDRTPRVQIVQTLETWGSERADELPFVVGVMADLSGTPEQPLPPLEARKFVDITQGTFDTVMGKVKPRASFRVKDKLTGQDREIGVDITFTQLWDFGPARVAEKVPWLKPLLDARRQLAQLLAQTDGKADAEETLTRILSDKEYLKSIVASGEPPASEGASKSLPAQ